MKNTIILFIAAISFLACKESEKTEIEPEFKDFSNIKSDDWKSKIGQEITVEGYLIQVAENTYKIVNDSIYAQCNTILDDKNYMLVQTLPSTGTFDPFSDLAELNGAKVTAKGFLSQYQPKNVSEESVIHSSKFIGNKHLATIALKELPIKLAGEKMKIATNDMGKLFNMSVIKPLPENRTKFALLYSGGVDAMQAYSHYYNNIQMMYNLLLKQGYLPQNIVVVYKDGKPDVLVPTSLSLFFRSYPAIPVFAAATPEGLNSAIEYLRKIMPGQKAELFLMVTNHGGGYHAGEGKNYSGQTDINADEPASDTKKLDEIASYYNSNQVLTDDQLATHINSLPFVALKALFLQCFSGGFIHDLRGPNRVLMSATNETEYSWGGGSNDLDKFFFNIITAIYAAGVNPLSNAIDLNRDGQLSIYEIFVNARALKMIDDKNRPSTASTPLYDDDGDGIANEPTAAGFGSKLTL